MTRKADFFVEAAGDGVDGRHLVEFGQGVRLMYPTDMLSFGLALLDFAPALASVDESTLVDFARGLIASGLDRLAD
jgi:hypothetical protein